MVLHADRNGVETTGSLDTRITSVGRFIRRYKIDELSQLWNVFIGNMSLVGPRPNTVKEVEKYNTEEKLLLHSKPGITDISSIIFSNESDIVGLEKDPEQAYDKLIRPLKCKLGLIYAENQNFFLDCYLIVLTLLAIINKNKSMDLTKNLLINLNCEDALLKELLATQYFTNSLLTKNLISKI